MPKIKRLRLTMVQRREIQGDPTHLQRRRANLNPSHVHSEVHPQCSDFLESAAGSPLPTGKLNQGDPTYA